MSARNDAVEMIRRICPPHLDRDQYGRILAEKFATHRAEVLREAAEAVDNTEFPDEYVDLFDNGARWASRLLRRLADDAAAGVQQTTEGEAELTATLVINRNDSYCDGCGKPTLPQRTHHTDISGWTPKPGGGCGAQFTAMRSDYGGITVDELKDVRPDLPVATPAAPAVPEERP
ncbi:hypothetical protein [Streptomyces sp. NPDC007346]|uniref:hypothetical protein n=1 Tax=Streptomyces sp. NPDC007346 TaxID=3154682 RepID=UPI00345368CD